VRSPTVTRTWPCARCVGTATPWWRWACGKIEDVPIVKDIPAGVEVDTVTLYMNADNQRSWLDRILALRPARIIFNPGAENPELVRRAQAQGASTLEACTLVMLSTGQY
jgi:uncharacterized protein